MGRQLGKLLKKAGMGAQFGVLLLLRCPFDALYTALQAGFLCASFDALGAGDAPGLVRACLSFGLAGAALFLYNGSVWTAFATAMVELEGRLREKLFSKLCALSPETVERKSRGEWLTRLNADVQALPYGRSLNLLHASCALVGLLVSSALLARQNPAAFWITAAAVLPQLLLNRRFVSKPAEPLSREILERTGEASEKLAGLVTCGELGHLYGATPMLLQKFEESSLELRRTGMRLWRRNALGAGLTPLFGLGGFLALLALGGTWVEEGSMTFGALSAALQYRAGAASAVSMLALCLPNIRGSMAGVRRLNETLEMRSEEEHG